MRVKTIETAIANQSWEGILPFDAKALVLAKELVSNLETSLLAVNCIPEKALPRRVLHKLLRIVQEAISNAIPHRKPTLVFVTLRWEANLNFVVPGFLETALKEAATARGRSVDSALDRSMILLEALIRYGPGRCRRFSSKTPRV